MEHDETRDPQEAYEPPAIEDLGDADGPAVTAAGATQTDLIAQ